MQPENVEVSVDLAKALAALGNFVDAVEILYVTNVSRKNSKVSQLLKTACIKLGQQTESTGSINDARTSASPKLLAKSQLARTR